MTKTQFFDRVNHWAKQKTPFLFLVDFEKKTPLVFSFEEAEEQGIFFDIKGQTNALNFPEEAPPQLLEKKGIPFEEYRPAFEKVHREINHGNSFLLNLTFPSKIRLKGSLKTVFLHAKAPYKMYWENRFTCFSPECFVRIEDDFIFTYPMKGTIDATLPNAKEKLLSNTKEEREHHTIVDLMRNDLSQIAREVSVTKFRFLEKVSTNEGPLYQTSSEIRGKLPNDWRSSLGEMLFQLLPAGSVSGAPKDKTTSIIRAAEKDKRGFYTGIFGVYTGTTLDTGVMIRFIEKNNDSHYFRSGGGITALSNAKEEYDELIQKIYLPIF